MPRFLIERDGYIPMLINKCIRDQIPQHNTSKSRQIGQSRHSVLSLVDQNLLPIPTSASLMLYGQEKDQILGQLVYSLITVANSYSIVNHWCTKLEV